MANQYILAIDQGTTSSRAIVFDADLQPVATAQRELRQIYPRSGWVEHDPEEIFSDTVTVCREAISATRVKDAGATMAAIGITNQRETTVVWDRDTGKPIHNAIVWQDRRTADFCRELREAGHEDLVKRATGLVIDPYFAGTKIRWLLDNVEGARDAAASDRLLAGTIDTWLIWRLTDGRAHVTDATNAGRTMAFDIRRQEWSRELCDMLGIPMAMLPEVLDTADDFGATNPSLFGGSIPILGVAGDQHAALVGQCCFEPGMIKSTYGTGCFALINTGGEPLASENRLLTTMGYRLNGKPTYALEGSIFIAGAAVQWLRDGLKLFKDAAETEALAAEGRADGPVFVPAFTGLGAPYWDPDARGAIFGLTRDTGIADLVRATLEAVAFQTRDLIEAMRGDGAEPEALRVDGGMTANGFLLQTLADLVGVPVERPENLESTALGAAMLAGAQAGVCRPLDELAGKWAKGAGCTPGIDAAARDAAYDRWKDAIARTRSSN